MQASHQTQTIINQKYLVLRTLGAGGVGVTYAAKDLETDKLVAIKALSLERMNNWKALELFEREAKILEQLAHPGIPSYLDSFQIDSDRNRAFYLVQQLAPGKPLSELIASGWKPQIAEIKDIARQILAILVYLQQLNPAIIHRDIKPQNIIRQSDGKIFLVDFGAVQDTYHHTVTGGSTVVGTFGYMAPEQFRGQANITSDLYGLGTTLLHLLTRKDPSELPQKNLKIQFRQQVSVAQDFNDWLERMLAPASEDRFADAEEALAVLIGTKKLTMLGVKKAKKPPIRHITLKRTKDRLAIAIPPAWKYSQGCKIAVVTWILLNLVFGLLIWIAIASHLLDYLLINSLYQKLFYLAIVGIFLIFNVPSYKYIVYPAFGFVYLRFDNVGFTFRRWLTRYKFNKITICDNLEHIQKVGFQHLGDPIFKNIFTCCFIWLPNFNLHFGMFLPRREQKQLLQEINCFLQNFFSN